MARHAEIVVVGAGAAGLMAAIAAGEAGSRGIVVLEGAPRLGAKILISGGGRCNVTNRHVTDADFNGGPHRAVARVLKAFPVARTIAFFESLGVPLHEEPRGKLFPDSNRARTVLDALVGAAHAARVEIHTGHRVESVSRQDGRFEVHAGDTWRVPRVILATGGRSVPKTGSDGHGLTMAAGLGHTIVPTTPALVPLLLSDDGFHARVAGVAHEVVLEVYAGDTRVARITGPLLWTHAGVSGPAALDASRHWHRAVLEGQRAEVRLNVCGGASFEQVDGTLVEAARGRTSIRAVIERWTPSSVAAELAGAAGVDPSAPLAHLPRDDRRRLVHALTASRLAIAGSRGFTHAEATAGGVSLDEIDPATMASRVCPGLYLAGEMLDVDGRLGGFNFQWAWSSGHVAGRAAASASQAPRTGV